jgi:5'(3')-deoxyribonucleotidase
MNKKIVFCDLDGVLADFAKAINNTTYEWIEDPPQMFEKGFYRNMSVVPGAREAISEILTFSGIELYIASKPTVKKTKFCPSEKYEWIEEHFPELLPKVFLTCNKGLLRGHYLIDDLEKWGKVFDGIFLHFKESEPEESWKRIVTYFRRYA